MTTAQFSIFTIITLLTSFISASSIIAHQIDLTPNNRNENIQYTIEFTLSTNINQNGFLKLKLSQAINTPTETKWAQLSSSCQTLTQSDYKPTTMTTADNLLFVISFFNDQAKSQRHTLQKGIRYQLTFKATFPTPNSVQTGAKGPIQMSTVSSNDVNAITYDTNPTFGVYGIEGDSSVLPFFTVILESGTTNDKHAGAIYGINIEFAPSKTIQTSARIVVELTNSEFSFVNCSLLNETVTTKFPELDKQDYPNLQTYQAIFKQTLKSDNLSRYKLLCFIQNPFATALQSGLKITTMKSYEQTIIESRTQNSILSTTLYQPIIKDNTWNLNSHNIKLGWGFIASDAQIPSVFQVYKDASSTERVYQSARIEFSPTTTIPNDKIYQIAIQHIPDSSVIILSNSIQHNLPTGNGVTSVTCDISTYVGSIRCKGLGGLQQGTVYTFGFRFNVPSTVDVSTVKSSLGSVAILTTGDTTTASEVLVGSNYKVLRTIDIGANPALHTSGANKGVLAFTQTTDKATTHNFIHSGIATLLNLKFKYFSNTIIDVTAARNPNYNKGFEIYTTYSLPQVTTPTCEIDGLTPTTDIILTDCSIINQANQYTRFRFRIGTLQATTNVNNLFTAAFNEGTIRFGNTAFDKAKQSQLNLINENIYDFYGRWVNNFQQSTSNPLLSTLGSQFMFNALVYEEGSLAGTDSSASFFISGGAGQGSNVATTFPSLIKVTSVLTPAEQTNAARLLLFFNDMDIIDKTKPCQSSSQIVDCSFIEGKLTYTETDGLSDYSGSNMVIIKPTTVTSAISVVIPVKSIENKNKIGFLIATAAEIGSAQTAQNIFRTLNIKRINAVDYSPAAINLEASGGSSADMTFPTGPKSEVNSAGALSLTTSAGYSIATTPTAGKHGAGYGICSDYEFYSETSFTISTYQGSATAEQAKCIPFKYKPTSSSTSDVFCMICPVYSSMGTPPSATNFKFSSSRGVDSAKYAYIVSTETGQLLKSVSIEKADVLTAKLLAGTTTLSASGGSLKKDTKNQWIKIKFTPTIDLPINFFIELKITTASSGTILSPSSSCQMIKANNIALSCVASSPSAGTLELAFTSSANVIIPKENEYEAIVFVDIDNTPSVAQIAFDFALKVNGISGKVSQQTQATINVALANKVDQTLTIDAITYRANAINALTSTLIKITLPDSNPITKGQSLVLNLGALATSSLADSTMIRRCLIKDNGNNGQNLLILTSFDSCSNSNLAQVAIKPSEYITQNIIHVMISHLKIPNQVNPLGLDAKILSFDGNSDVITSGATKKDLGLGNSVLSFLPSSINVFDSQPIPAFPSKVQVKVFLRDEALQTTDSIFIIFPTYFSPNLGYQNLYCSYDSAKLDCSIVEDYTLRVTNFKANLAKLTTIILDIYGISYPEVPTNSNEKFYISINKGTDPAQVIQHGTVPKLVHKQYPAIFNPSFTVGQGSIRLTTTYSLLIDTTSLTKPIGTGAYIVFSYPSEYSNDLYDQILLRGGSNMINSAYISFTVNSNQGNLGIQDAQSNSDITQLDLQNGIYSQLIRIIPQGAPSFPEDFKITETSGLFITLPTTLQASRGQSKLEFRIALKKPVTISSTQEVYFKPIAQSQGTIPYSNPPKLTIKLISTKKSISLSNFNIPVGGFSLPQIVNLEAINGIPVDNFTLVIEPQNPGNTGFIVESGQSVLFNSVNRTGSIVFAIGESVNATTQSKLQVKLSLSGTDSASYSLSSTNIEGTVIEAIQTSPTLSNLQQLAADNSIQKTQFAFDFNIDQISNVYYYNVFQHNYLATDCKDVKAKATIPASYNTNDPLQAQYGIIRIPAPASPYKFTLSNLLLNEDYTVQVCAENQGRKYSLILNNQFKSQESQGGIFNINLVFTEAMSQFQLASICCYFSTKLFVPKKNVLSESLNISCADKDITNPNAKDVSRIITIALYGDKRASSGIDLPTEMNYLINNISTVPTSSQRTDFNTFLKTIQMDQLFQSTTYNQAPNPISPSFSGSTTLIELFQTISVKGITLNQGGTLYAMIYPKSSGLTITQEQIKLGTQSTTIPQIQSQKWSLTKDQALQLNFTSLDPYSTFQISYFAEVGTIEDYTKYTNVITLDASTKKYNLGSSIHCTLIGLNLLVFVIFVFI